MLLPLPCSSINSINITLSFDLNSAYPLGKERPLVNFSPVPACLIYSVYSPLLGSIAQYRSPASVVFIFTSPFNVCSVFTSTKQCLSFPSLILTISLPSFVFIVSRTLCFSPSTVILIPIPPPLPTSKLPPSGII